MKLRRSGLQADESPEIAPCLNRLGLGCRGQSRWRGDGGTSFRRGATLARAVGAAFIAFAALAQTGCVSSKYQLAPYQHRAIALQLEATSVRAEPSLSSDPSGSLPPLPAPGVRAAIEHVIALRGPGSWKKNAYWDEYVVALVNSTDTPITLESATLTDFQGQPVAPGTDPWALERQSRDFEARLASTAGNVVKIGSGVLLASGTGIAAGAATALAASASGYTAIGIIGVGMIAAVPVYAVGTVYRNLTHKHKVEAEFRERALVLPLTLPPATSVRGSFFFRISPGPQQLLLRAVSPGAAPCDLVIPLSPALAGLHLKPATSALSPPR